MSRGSDWGWDLSWFLLFIAGLFEVGWAIGLKYTEGFTRPGPTVATLACMAVSVYLLGVAVRELPVGTAYAVWTGIGAVGTALVGMQLFHEPRTVGRLLCIGLIASGIIGLKLTAPKTPETSPMPAADAAPPAPR